MKKEKILRTKRLLLYFTQEEYQRIKIRQQNSTCPNMGVYFRKLLFTNRIVTTYRNRSQDDILDEISLIRKNLELLNERIDQKDVEAKTDLHPMVKEVLTSLDSTVRKMLDVW